MNQIVLPVESEEIDSVQHDNHEEKVTRLTWKSGDFKMENDGIEAWKLDGSNREGV